MTGLFLYAFVAAGLGCLLPRSWAPGAGLGYFLGFCVFVLAFFVGHVAIGLPLALVAWPLLVLAAIGLARNVSVLGDGKSLRALAAHPVPLVTAAGFLAIAVQGGIGYLPYGSDEFGNWLGAARHIHAIDDYARIRDTIHLTGYTPGWRLALLFPWVVTGTVQEGQSASAPFVMSVGLIGVIYDVLTSRLRRTGLTDEIRTRLIAWAIVLAGLTVEIAGLAWTRTLLIEPPQIYTLAAFILVLYGAEEERGGNRAIAAGLVLACAYLVKAAALAVVPAVLLLALFRIRSAGTRDALRWTAAMLVPLAVTVLCWRLRGPATETGIPGVLDTFRGELLAQALQADWRDLAARFLAAVRDYVLSYKAPLTLLAASALLLAALRGTWQASLAWAGFAFVYMALLYWFHLAAFGAYYFANLNSIQRFTLVPLQALHTLGFVVAACLAMDLVSRRQAWARPIAALAKTRTGLLCLCAACVVLAGVQVRGLLRSVEDMTTRRFQDVDPRVAEARSAAAIMERAIRTDSGPGEPPVLAIVAQGMDSEPINYVRYFARRKTGPGEYQPPFRTLGVSWTDGEPVNAWQQRTTIPALSAELAKSRVIWPMRLDPWAGEILRALVRPGACAAIDERIYMVREADEAMFTCRDKPGETRQSMPGSPAARN